MPGKGAFTNQILTDMALLNNRDRKDLPSPILILPAALELMGVLPLLDPPG